MARSKKKSLDEIAKKAVSEYPININDMYETPEYCIELLWSLCREMLPTPHFVIDIGAGDGRIGYPLQSAFAIGPHLDLPKLVLIDPRPTWDEDKVPGIIKITGPFLESFGKEKVFNSELQFIALDRLLIVSNPPFSQAFEMVQQSVALLKDQMPGSAAVFLLRQNWFASKKRAQWLTANPYNRNVSIAPRPSFANEYKDNPKGQSDMHEYGWFFWFNGEASKVFWPHSVRVGKK